MHIYAYNNRADIRTEHAIQRSPINLLSNNQSYNHNITLQQ